MANYPETSSPKATTPPKTNTGRTGDVTFAVFGIVLLNAVRKWK
jgi:hypothetical protein